MKKILFGAGKIGQDLLREGKISDVAYFCDNYKFGKKVLGIEVINFEQLLVKHNKYQVILTVIQENAKQEIKKMLEDNNIPYTDYIDLDEIKYASEYGYWEMVFEREKRHFNNSHYKELILGIAGEKNDDFLNGKVVADFGCGPRGSLAWMERPAVKIGIDVLSQYYFEKFGDDMVKHGMIYVTSTEKHIPLPTNSVDCLLSINSLDHVRYLKEISDEMLRIMKKGGLLLCSFNLNEPKTECEPQTLNEELLNDILLDNFRITSYKIAKKDYEETYKNMMDGKYVDRVKEDEAYILWVAGYKL